MKTAYFALLLLVVGCTSFETRTYDVSLKNMSVNPVTIWITKNGPAWEAGWKSPEDLAIESPGADERIPGVVVPSGKTAAINKHTGRFAPNVSAILRVYAGQQGINELLAMSHRGPDRVDVVLQPGANNLVAVDEGGGIKVNRMELQTGTTDEHR